MSSDNGDTDTGAALRRPMVAADLRELRLAGVLSAEEYWAGLRAANPALGWALLASRFCLAIGVALLLAGVVFFFAYNWAELSGLQKLGLTQSGMIALVVGAQWLGLGRESGRYCLFAAALLLGVNFAVFGQAYQTGADAFGLFVAWGILIVPWALGSSFAPLWVLLLIMGNLATFFFWDQVGQFREDWHYAWISLLLAAMNGVALALREWQAVRRPWLRGRWLRPLLLSGMLVPASLPACHFVTAGGGSQLPLFIGFILWVAALLGLFGFYWRMRFDPVALSLILLSGAAFVLTLAARVLNSLDLFDLGPGFLLMAILMVALTTGLIMVVRCIAKEKTISPEERL